MAPTQSDPLLAKTTPTITTAPEKPSLPWRTASSMIMGVTGALSRTFLFACNTTETVGLNKFLRYLDSREDPADREKGLITGSLH